MAIESDFNGIYDTHSKALYQNQDEWKSLLETGHPHLVPIRDSMLEIGQEGTARCALCYVPQQGYDAEVEQLRTKNGINDLDIALHKMAQGQPGQGSECVVRKSKRNELFCNCCDAYIEAFPGGADVELPILIADVRRSTATITKCSPAEGAVLGLELRSQVSEIVSSNSGYMLQDRGDGFMYSFPYGFAPLNTKDNKQWALDLAVRAAVRLAHQAVIPAPSDSSLRLGIGLNHGATYVGAPAIDALPNRIDMILVLGSATATIAARLSDLASEGTAVIAASTLEGSGIDPEKEGWKVETLTDSIVPAYRISP